MALVETKEIRPFNKIENLELTSDNKFLQLLEIQYNKISEASRFNDKYQPIGKGTNNVVETIANSEKTKKVFEFVKGALTVGIFGFAAINNVGITETLGNFFSIIPGVGEGLRNIITSPGGNGIISQLFADSSLGNVINKIGEEVLEKKDIVKEFVIDKLPRKLKEKYFEFENKKEEKRMQLESEYPKDKAAFECNRELYKRKSKEILKEIFSKDKKEDKEHDITEQIVNSNNEQVEKEEKTNPWQISQEQRQEQRRNNNVKQSSRKTKTIDNNLIEKEEIEV